MAVLSLLPYILTPARIAKLKKRFDEDGTRNLTGEDEDTGEYFTPQPSRYQDACIAQKIFVIALQNLKFEIESGRPVNRENECSIWNIKNN